MIDVCLPPIGLRSARQVWLLSLPTGPAGFYQGKESDNPPSKKLLIILFLWKYS